MMDKRRYRIPDTGSVSGIGNKLGHAHFRAHRDQARGKLTTPIDDSRGRSNSWRLVRSGTSLCRLLGVASVLGRDIELALLCDVARCEPAAALDALGPAVEAGLVRETGLASWAFSHMLVKETLYRDLRPAQRAELHGRAGRALEAMRTAQDRPLARIGHHFLLAAPGGHADKAVAYEREAGRDAHSRLAYEDAAFHFRRALDALDLGSRDEQVCVELSLELGESLRCAGDMTAALEVFDRASGVARAIGDHALLARAADGYAASQQNVIDPNVVERLDEALAVLPERNTALHARLLARLARALTFSPDWQRPEDVGREAVAIAKRLADPATLALVMNARRWSMRFAGAEETLGISTEAVEAAEAAGDGAMAAEARIWRACDLMGIGRMDEARAEIAEHERAAEALRQPWHHMIAVRFRAMLALLEGRFEEGEALVADALARAEAIGDQNGQLIHWIHLTVLRRDGGRYEECEPFARAIIQLWSWNPALRCALTLLLADVGREAEARAELDGLAKDDFAIIPPDLNRLTALANLSEACALLGHAAHAETLYRLLAPHAARNVVVAGPSICTGPVTRFLGMLAAAAGRFEEAFAHFDDALARCEQMRARPWIVYTREQYARALVRRGAPGDRARATAFASSALALASEIGMSANERRLVALLSGVDVRHPAEQK